MEYWIDGVTAYWSIRAGHLSDVAHGLAPSIQSTSSTGSLGPLVAPYFLLTKIESMAVNFGSASRPICLPLFTASTSRSSPVAPTLAGS